MKGSSQPRPACLRFTFVIHRDGYKSPRRPGNDTRGLNKFVALRRTFDSRIELSFPACNGTSECVPAVGQCAAASLTRLFINKSANGRRNRRRIPRQCSSVIAFPFGSRVAARKDTEELYSIFRAGGLRKFFEFIRFPVSLAAAKFRFHRRNFFGNHFQRVGRELRVHHEYPRNSRAPRSLFVFMPAIAKFSGRLPFSSESFFV